MSLEKKVITKEDLLFGTKKKKNVNINDDDDFTDLDEDDDKYLDKKKNEN